MTNERKCVKTALGIAEGLLMDAPNYDAEVLERAAQVLKRRSKRPNGFWLGVVCKMLVSVAQDLRIDAGENTDR